METNQRGYCQRQIETIRIDINDGGLQVQREKDNIFALLSLCAAKERKYFSSDYDLPVRSLMVKVTQYFMNTRELQSPMKFLQTHQDGKTVSLPSWVPDYTSEDVESHFMIPRSKAAHRTKPVQTTRHGRCLGSRLSHQKLSAVDV